MKLLLNFILFFLCSSVFATPSIIYLKGTCCAGKSTFIRSIQHDDLVIVDEDSIMHEFYIDAVAKAYPFEFERIQQAISRENIYHALREQDVLFKKTAYLGERHNALNALDRIKQALNVPELLIWKKEVSHQIDLEVLRQIKEALDCNKNVLLDSWYIKPKQLQELHPTTPVFKVLLYCPLDLAYERLLQRNKEAILQENLQEKRYLRQLVGSFFSMYQVGNDPANSLQELKKGELDQVLETMSLTLKNIDPSYQKPIFTFDEISKEAFIKLKDEFLKPFETFDKLYISPKDEYDFIFQTEKLKEFKPEQLLSPIFCNRDEQVVTS